MKKLYGCLALALASGLSGSAQCTFTPAYWEGFNISTNNQMPNCWAATNFSSTTLTFSQGYAAFTATQAGSDYFFSPAFQLKTGVVYSVTAWHAVNTNSVLNFSSISLMLGTSQSSTGMNVLASAVPASVNYAALSTTFNVTSSGVYYIGVRGTASSPSNGQILKFDDFELTIPCTIASNQPTISITPNPATVCANPQIMTSFSACCADTYTWSTGNQSSVTTIPLLFSQQLSVIATSTLTACTASRTATLTVKPSPIISAFAIPPAVCSGGSATIIASGGSSYSWAGGPTGTSGTFVITPASNTVITVTGSAANGCSTTSSISIVVNPNPQVTLAPNTSTACANDPVKLTASGGLGYVWPGASGFSSTRTITALSTTVYQVIGIDQNGCSDTAEVTVVVTSCDHIQEEHITPVSIYPNPVKDILNIEGAEGSVTILNALGELVFVKTIGPAEPIHISELPAGFYFLRIQQDHYSRSTRFIKQ
jgi:hypothetical protein